MAGGKNNVSSFKWTNLYRDPAETLPESKKKKKKKNSHQKCSAYGDLKKLLLSDAQTTF